MQTAITRTSGPGRVLLVDDHPAVRRVLRSPLEEVGGWQVVGEADSGEAAIPLVEQLAPDVVLMDCRMPGQGGVATTREIVQRWPEVAVVASSPPSPSSTPPPPAGGRGRPRPVPGRPAGQGMGGRVWVEDNEGGGARFVVALPDQAPV